MIPPNRNRLTLLKIFSSSVRKHFSSFLPKRATGSYKKLNNELDKNPCIKFRLNRSKKKYFCIEFFNMPIKNQYIEYHFFPQSLNNCRLNKKEFKKFVRSNHQI